MFTQNEAMAHCTAVFTLMEKRNLSEHEVFALCCLLLAIATRTMKISEVDMLKGAAKAYAYLNELKPEVRH